MKGTFTTHDVIERVWEGQLVGKAILPGGGCQGEGGKITEPGLLTLSLERCYTLGRKLVLSAPHGTVLTYRAYLLVILATFWSHALTIPPIHDRRPKPPSRPTGPPGLCIRDPGSLPRSLPVRQMSPPQRK